MAAFSNAEAATVAIVDAIAAPQSRYAARKLGAAIADHGYTLQDYNLGEQGMTLKRLAGIMQARGVRGILVCPMPAAHRT